MLSHLVLIGVGFSKENIFSKYLIFWPIFGLKLGSRKASGLKEKMKILLKGVRETKLGPKKAKASKETNSQQNRPKEIN